MTLQMMKIWDQGDLQKAKKRSSQEGGAPCSDFDDQLEDAKTLLFLSADSKDSPPPLVSVAGWC